MIVTRDGLACGWETIPAVILLTSKSFRGSSRGFGNTPHLPPRGRADLLVFQALGSLSIAEPLVRREGKPEAGAAPNPKPRGVTTMRFMILVKANKDSEAGVLPDEKILTEMGKFNQRLEKAGVLLAAEGLQASSKGARVKFSGGKRTVTDGPFADTKELVAGFWAWQVKSKEEAIEWVKRAPFGDGVEIEIRQVFEAEDFGPALKPEFKEQEE